MTKVIEAELEEAVNVTTTTTSPPKVKSMQAKGDKKGKDGGKGQGDGKGKSKDDVKGKGKKGKSDNWKEPCQYFNSEDGCRFCQTCKGYHRMLKPEECKCRLWQRKASSLRV